VTTKTRQLAHEALALPPKERASLADKLLFSLDRPDLEIDSLWKTESERRLRAYKAGKIKAVPLSKVLMDYRKKKAA
jgi:putative addiction module component (TIGR02574 family)